MGKSDQDLIIINPHNSSDEDVQELLDYLDGKCWDYRRDYPSS